jgi:ubiquinone/menaquinone biosynthesis C-methylase UbiE
MSELATERRYGRVFDEVAAEYDRNRPAYPDELVDHVCELAGIGRGDPVLEVGCGTGQLTRSLVARGLDVTALDPGEQLISLTERKLRRVGRLESVNARFEDAALLGERFRAVFSAGAFQWIDPDVSWAKAARLLAPGGTLALIQYCGLEDARIANDHAALLSALRRIAPEIAANWPAYRDVDAIVAGAEQRRQNVSDLWSWVGCHDLARPGARRLFGDVQVACVTTGFEQTAEQLNGLLRTASFYARLSPDRRRAIEREHVELYERIGRPIRSSMVAVLVTARRRGDRRWPASSDSADVRATTLELTSR